jgi:hypothetical protein
MRTKGRFSPLFGIAILVASVGLTGGALLAEEPAKTHETAVFSVPGLSDQALIKNLAGALSKHEGVVSAKIEAQEGRCLITFDPGKTNPEALTKTVSAVAPESKLESTRPTEGKAGEGDACGKCPSKSSCGKKK